jgi:lysyl-tRNA synthetase class 2
MCAAGIAFPGALMLFTVLTHDVPWHGMLQLSPPVGQPADSAMHVLVGIAGCAVIGLAAAQLAGRRSPANLASLVLIGISIVHLDEDHGLWWALAPAGLAALIQASRGLALLRPRPAADGHTVSDHHRAAVIVGHHARDSLDPFALREDKAFHFAAGGFVAYRTLRETAVVSGDPIGPEGSAGPAMEAFLDHAHGHGWDVVVTGASDRWLDEYRALGLRTLHIGNEAVVDPRTFTLEGRKVRKVRQSVARVERHGWSVEVVDADRLTDVAISGIARVEASWRAERPRIQGFAMTLGRLWGAGEDQASLYVLGRDDAGEVRAFLRFAAYEGGLSLDSMRRSGETPNGLNEAMVVAALTHARELGLREVSLNFAGFSHVMAASAALSPGARLMRFGLSLAHGRFQLERLVRFNDKFFPQWRPRYLVYSRRTDLPLVALRVLQAEAYLRPPRTPRRRPQLTARWRPLSYPVGQGAR